MVQKPELLYVKSCFPRAGHLLLSATFGIKNHPATTGYETYLFLFLLFPYDAKRAEVSRVQTASWWSFAAPHRPREVPGPASQALWPARSPPYGQRASSFPCTLTARPCGFHGEIPMCSHFLSFGLTALSFPRRRPPSLYPAAGEDLRLVRPGHEESRPYPRRSQGQPRPTDMASHGSHDLLPCGPCPALTRLRPPGLRPRQRRKSRSRRRQAHV